MRYICNRCGAHLDPGVTLPQELDRILFNHMLIPFQDQYVQLPPVLRKGKSLPHERAGSPYMPRRPESSQQPARIRS